MIFLNAKYINLLLKKTEMKKDYKFYYSQIERIFAILELLYTRDINGYLKILDTFDYRVIYKKKMDS